MGEHRATIRDLFRPERLALRIKTSEELIGIAFLDAPFRHAGQNHTVGRYVRAVGIVGVDVDERVAGAGVVLAEVKERRAAEALHEFPVGPLPRLAVVLRPGELRVASVACPQIQHALDTENAAGLLARGPLADLFTTGGRNVDALKSW